MSHQQSIKVSLVWLVRKLIVQSQLWDRHFAINPSIDVVSAYINQFIVYNIVYSTPQRSSWRLIKESLNITGRSIGDTSYSSSFPVVKHTVESLQIRGLFYSLSQRMACWTNATTLCHSYNAIICIVTVLDILYCWQEWSFASIVGCIQSSFHLFNSNWLTITTSPSRDWLFTTQMCTNIHSFSMLLTGWLEIQIDLSEGYLGQLIWLKISFVHGQSYCTWLTCKLMVVMECCMNSVCLQVCDRLWSKGILNQEGSVTCDSMIWLMICSRQYHNLWITLR